MAKKKRGPSADELRAKVTDRLVAALENGVRPWIKPWVCDPNAGFPTNIASKKRYRGVNPWMLNLTALESDYSSKWWGTYKQWKEKGGQVIKGNKGTMIVFWKVLRIADPESDDGGTRKIFLLKYSTVFNLDQVESVGEPGELADGTPKAHPLDKYRIDTSVREKFEHGDGFQPAEELIADSGATINYGGSRACYNPGSDEISMPEKDRFAKLSEFYNTAFHELTHWCEKRTGFDKVDDKSYALGELVAEIGACFVSEEIGVPMDNPEDDQSAAYLKSWLKRLKDDSKFIFVASKWASKAADMLLGETVEYDNDDDKSTEPVMDKAA
tara:strand:+ start:186 stop:1166 length:981 start_codon:yes stop_codon:yes gene_type:complete